MSRPLSIAYAKTLLDVDRGGQYQRFVEELVRLIEEDLDQWFEHGVKKGLHDGNIRTNEVPSGEKQEDSSGHGRPVRQSDGSHPEGSLEGDCPHQGRL